MGPVPWNVGFCKNIFETLRQLALPARRRTLDEADPTHDGEHGASEEEAEAVGVLARLEEEVQADRGAGAYVHFSAQLERFVWDRGCA
jgi:hypothetical protein